MPAVPEPASGSNARSGPAAGGSVGTASSVTSSGFTLTTSTGQKVTIKEASSTTYEQGTSPASISAVTSGAPVLVLGTTDSTTITATRSSWIRPAAAHRLPAGRRSAYSKGTQGSTETGRHDPVGLHPGVGDPRQRHDRGQGHRSRAGRLPGRRRRPGRRTQQRRLRGPQHRRQLAPPHLRQRGLPGHRRQRLAGGVCAIGKSGWAAARVPAKAGTRASGLLGRLLIQRRPLAKDHSSERSRGSASLALLGPRGARSQVTWS